MRSFIVLCILGLAAAGHNEKQAECVLNSAEAVSDAMDAGVYLWAAAKRCGKPGLVWKCALDAVSVVESVNSMIAVILKAVDKCGELKTKHKKCGFAAAELTKHTAGLAGAAAMIAQKCPKAALATPYVGMAEAAAPVMCTVDMKNTAKWLFHAINDLQPTKKLCEKEDKKDCAANAMDIMGAFAGMGSYLAGAIGHCRRTFAKTAALALTKEATRHELCSEAAAALLQHSAKIAAAGIKLSEECHVSAAARLYEQPRLQEQHGNLDVSGAANLILGAFLPITAVVGFVGGRYYGNRGQSARVAVTSDIECDNE